MSRRSAREGRSWHLGILGGIRCLSRVTADSKLMKTFLDEERKSCNEHVTRKEKNCWKVCKLSTSRRAEWKVLRWKRLSGKVNIIMRMIKTEIGLEIHSTFQKYILWMEFENEAVAELETLHNEDWRMDWTYKTSTQVSRYNSRFKLIIMAAADFGSRFRPSIVLMVVVVVIQQNKMKHDTRKVEEGRGKEWKYNLRFSRQRDSCSHPKLEISE